MQKSFQNMKTQMGMPDLKERTIKSVDKTTRKSMI